MAEARGRLHDAIGPTGNGLRYLTDMHHLSSLS